MPGLVLFDLGLQDLCLDLEIGQLLAKALRLLKGEDDRPAPAAKRNVSATTVVAALRFENIATHDGGRDELAEDLATLEREENLLSLIDTALREDEFALHLQPIVSLRDENSPLIVEVLIRLPTQEFGVLASHDFLDTAERHGRMPAIDRWVIRNALAHFSELHPAGARLGTCAINLSGASIEDEGLADFILGLIAQYGIPAQKICFEITETVAVRNLLRVVNMIERLRDAGCLIALDDFGAGMSSFGYLKNLPVDMIKIDGSFVRDLDTDPMSHTIINAITQIGHQRGLKVVAEWVSAKHMVKSLHSLGVDYGQGFALHRPERVLFQRTGSEWRRVVGH